MRKTIYLALFVVACLTASASGQKRPVRRPTATPPLAKAGAGEPPSAAKAFYNNGLKCGTLDFDCQISNFTKAINLGLNTKEVFQKRGDAYIQKAEYQKAIADLGRAIELDKNDEHSYLLRGKALYAAAQNDRMLDSAIADFASAIELEPNDALAYKFRAIANFTRTNFEAARADLNRSEALNPGDPDITGIRVKIAEENGNTQSNARIGARPNIDQLSELEAWNTVKNSSLAKDYWQFLQRYPGGTFSKEALDKMVEIGDPEWNKVRDTRDPYQFRSYLERNPDGPFSSLALERLKSSTEAIIAWEKVDKNDRAALAEFIKRYPDSKPADEAKSAIEVADKIREAKGRTNELGIRFVSIPPGSFDIDNTKGPHHASITREFYLSKYEVTQAQWRAVMGANPSIFKQCGDMCPVEHVSWADAQRFIAKLNSLNDGMIYRLPTIFEWEYAAKAGLDGLDDGARVIGDLGWFSNNSGGTTHPVGQKAPNGFGLYDMFGNASEWCEDWFDDYPPQNLVDPKGPSKAQFRSPRGGTWAEFASASNAFRVFGLGTDQSTAASGLRLAATPR